MTRPEPGRPFSWAAFLRLAVGLIIVGAGAAGCGGSGSSGNTRQYSLASLEQVTVSLADTNFQLWVMDTESKRQEGLMSVSASDVGDNQGMLFAFPDSQVRYFWMKNTGLPLDIAYLDSSGKVVSISQMQPFSLDAISSTVPAQYAIEVKQGTFTHIGLVTGMHVTVPAVSAHR